MRVLLDTHAFLWFILGDDRLSEPVRATIEDAGNVCFVSAATVWEVAVKHSLGKLPLAEPFDDLFPAQIAGNGFGYLPVEVVHCSAATRLPFHHRDPFDRMLIAQAIVEGMPLVTKDAEFGPYLVRTVW